MDYEDRLTCFIDVLGFKDATHQSVKNFEVRKQIYDVIHSLKAEKISTFVYDSLPLAQPKADGTVTHTTLKSLDNQELKENITKELNLTITQFSDSFVLSCPSNDDVSCNLLLKAVYLINIMFFSNLGMVMRGAITKGKLIHEEKGALFGPSMVEAYELESKSSIYPRIIITSDANELIYSNHTLLNQQGIVIPDKKFI